MTKIDSIVRDVLLQKGLSAHYYIRLLSFGLECVKELELDIIGRIRSKVLTLDPNRRAPLPCGYVDWIRVGTNSGQYVINLGSTSKFNRRNNEVGGTIVSYTDAESTVDISYTDYDDLDRWLNNNGEFVGRQFGGNGTRRDQFMVVQEEGVIQFDISFEPGSTVTMDYISHDPTDALASIHKYAESTVKAYMEWRYVSHLPRANGYDKSTAERTYYREMKKLIARKSDVTPEGVKRLIRRRYRLTT